MMIQRKILDHVQDRDISKLLYKNSNKIFFTPIDINLTSAKILFIKFNSL